MLYLGTTPLAGNIKTKLFTSSGTFVVPADVYCIWIDGSGGGGGGGGGNSTPGGGGGGGGAANCCLHYPSYVTPGETLVVSIAAGGAGGAVNGYGLAGATTELLHGSVLIASMQGGGGGFPGTNPNGGDAGKPACADTGPSGGVGTSGGSGFIFYGANSGSLTHYFGSAEIFGRLANGSGGGALGFGGGAAAGVQGGYKYRAASIGNSSGGGGGHGGCATFGDGGIGGSNGAAGEMGAGYGAGGGGGSGNSAGGNGSPGFVRIYYISKYTVA